MHARNLAQNPDVDRITLLGRDGTRLAEVAQSLLDSIAPGSPADIAGEHAPASAEVDLAWSTGSIDSIAADIDGLVIASPTASHPQLARQAARAGLPVLVEKPLSLDLDELKMLSDELDGLSAQVMVAFHRRYDPAHQSLRRRVSAGELGRLRIVRATGHDHLPLALDYIPKSGGMWHDMLIHDFDAIPWVTGERVVRVQAVGSVLDEPLYGEYGDTDTAAAILTLESGALALVSGTRRNGAGQDVRLEVCGSDNTFSVGLEPRMAVTSTEPDVPGPERPYPQFIDRFEIAFRSEIAHFLRLVRGEDANLTQPRSGIHAIEIAEAAALSRLTAAPVLLPAPSR
ncbi:myo-inositol 2-dehydrogenase/D-chiro-inositol 1-dehydrogenase [Cryobacterium roopkundense]|nr:myo-inositol 2-dehydrogenase/D-chiro-inositol 1-dehydrogenase [Cryobacterium roopkundense]